MNKVTLKLVDSEAAVRYARRVKFALSLHRDAMDLYRRRHESGDQRIKLELLEYQLQENKDILLTRHGDEAITAPIERAAQLATMLAWMYREKLRLAPFTRENPRINLRVQTLKICKFMRPVAHKHYQEAPYLFYDLLLSEAQVQKTQGERLARLRQAGKGIREVGDLDRRALLYARLGAIYHEYFIRWNWPDCLRGWGWKIRALHVRCSYSVHNEIKSNIFWYE